MINPENSIILTELIVSLFYMSKTVNFSAITPKYSVYATFIRTSSALSFKREVDSQLVHLLNLLKFTQTLFKKVNQVQII
ncbi:hypothetical protein BpHYR1_030006 [Brachionus plicatilis]|uniref:Uncharacterized protein n=1 Tax=Brachionus plicatilis TaxID=10195 RepID=A0A3M7QU13_BRAPC|nr:hypothetical protein BpHYR1_030006 [Brachionus plicatilis]